MHILTFDIEEWYHILNHPETKTPAQWETFMPRIEPNTDRILQILSDRHQKATFFVISWIAEKHPAMVKKILAEGHEIGIHSHGHQLIFEQSREEFREDIRKAKGILSDLTGMEMKMYRAPGFSIKQETMWALEILMEEGIEVDASIFPATRMHGGCAGFPTSRPCIVDGGGMQLKEFPVNTSTWLGHKFVFSGGGYFRATPYPMLRRMSKQADYLMTYFHPRDFDARQPMVPKLPLHRQWMSYHGLKGSKRKLERWLDEFRFIDLATAIKQIDWEKQPVVKLEELSVK